MHLDAQRLQQLLAGGLSAEDERELAAHLAAEDCEVCATFLESLDPSRERTMLHILSRSLQARDLAVQAQERVLHRGGRWYGLRLALVPAALLAALALIVLAVALGAHFSAPRSTRDETDTVGVKGPGSARLPRVRLSLGRVQDADGGSRLERLGNGAMVPRGSRVVFRIETDGPCHLYLLHQDVSSRPDVLVPNSLEDSAFFPGGALTPTAAGAPAAVVLERPGTSRFVALCAAKPIDLQDRLPELAGQDVISYDLVTLEVVGEDGR